jgi:hypothetical protein
MILKINIKKKYYFDNYLMKNTLKINYSYIFKQKRSFLFFYKYK